MDDADTDQVEIVDVMYNVAFTSARTKLKVAAKTPENSDKASAKNSLRKSKSPKAAKSSSKKLKSKISNSCIDSVVNKSKRKTPENSPSSSSKKCLKFQKVFLDVNDNDGEADSSVEMTDSSVYIVERSSDTLPENEQRVGLSAYITPHRNDPGQTNNSEKSHKLLNKRANSPKVKIHLAKCNGDSDKVVYTKSAVSDDLISPKPRCTGEIETSDVTTSLTEAPSKRQDKEAITPISNTHKDRKSKKSPKVATVSKPSQDASKLAAHDTADTIANDEKAEEDSTLMSDDVCEQKPIIKHYLGSDGVLVVLDHPQQVVMKGKAMVSVLCGEADVLGYRLTSTRLPVPVFSPGTHSRIVLSTITGSSRNGDSLMNKKACDNLHQLCGDKALVSEVLSVLTDSSVVVVCQTMKSCVWDYLSTYGQYHSALALKDDGTDFDSVGIDIESPVDTWAPAIDVSAESYNQVDAVWSSCLKQKGTCRLLSCGGKNAGKSTLNRYLINTALNSVDKVLYLECDPGQTEFTAPGCISLSVITEPVVGPPFSHQREPLFVCFLGHVSVAECARLYIGAVQTAYRAYLSLSDTNTPLIINTMGWNQGLGLQINIDVIRVVQPSIIIQINQQKAIQNFPHMLPHMVNHDSNGWAKKTELDLSGDCAYEVITVDSAIKSSPMFLSAAEHRYASCLAYFISCTDGVSMTSLLSAEAYKVPWSSVAVHVHQPGVPPEQIMYALNATLVALCSAPIDQYERIGNNDDWPRLCSELPICKCVGLGLIRGIDPVDGMLYIITPIAEAELANVTLIVRGTIGLPDTLFVKQKASNVPYVGQRQLSVGSEALRPRKHMKRRHSRRTWIPQGK